MDFSDQQAVFRDLQNKYGINNVARIIAFGTLTPKSVSRKVLSSFGHEAFLINTISKLIPEGAKTFADAFQLSPELQAYAKKFPTEFKVMQRLQGTTSNLSQHAGGILIYPNLGDYLPLSWDRDKEIFVAGFDKKMLAKLGHFKFDILGLETLPILHSCVNAVRKIVPDFDITKINLEDKAVYDMLCEGSVSGVFQLSAQSTKVIQQQPRNFRDLIAINALIRP